MTTTFSNEYSALSPFVALIQQIVDQTISESGVAATSYATLSDRLTANLPVINGPLGVALSALADKTTALAHYSNVNNPHNVTAAQIGAVPAGSLATINGNSLTAGGNIVVGGATPVNDLTTGGTGVPLSAQQGVTLKGLVDAKAPQLAPFDLGSGAIALTAALNANRGNHWNGSTTVTATIDTTGGTVHDIYSVTNIGSGTVNLPGTAGAGYKTSIGPNSGGAVEWLGGTTFISWIPDASGAAAAPPVTVTGSTVNGSVLTRALGSGWTEPGGNWTRDNTNISGATSTTYTTVSADGGHTVTWKSANIPYIPTGIAVANVVVTTQIVRFTDLTTGGDGVTESGDGTTGWIYQIGDFANGWASFAGGANLSLGSGVDGSVAAKLNTVSGQPIGHMFGLATSNPKQIFTGWSYNIFAYGSDASSGTYSSTTSPTTDNAIAVLPGDNLRWSRTGSTLKAQVARSGTPTTWIDALIWTGASTGVLYPAFNWRGWGTGTGNATTGPITGLGLV